MNKIGIITFQYAYNYGAILQLSAMQKVLKNCGVKSEAINYLPPAAKELPFWKGWGLTKGDLFNNIQKRVVTFKHGPKTRERFDLFRKDHLSISNPCFTNEDLSKITKNYDAVITGSDQVWHFSNPSPYFLQWGNEYKGRRISYAPSCGKEDQPIARYNDVRQWIKQMDYISVRDEVSRKVINDLSKIEPEIVADPTLLTDLNDLQSPIKIPYDNYIFMYVLGKEINGGHQGIINSIRKYYADLPVVALVASAHKPQIFDWADYVVWDAGPSEWLYLVSNSSFVYTDSYHCSLFALKNNKPFLSYYSEIKRAPRLLDLAERYQVRNNVSGGLDEAIKNEFWKVPDYQKVSDLIENQVKSSLSFLKKALNLQS